MSRELTAEDILGADDMGMERVDVPEWGGHLFVAVLTGLERDQWEIGLAPGKGAKPVNIRASLVAVAARNAKGERLFTSKQAEALGAKSSAALDRVFSVAQRINGLRDDDVEALAGNSNGEGDDAGTSNSPTTSASPT